MIVDRTVGEAISRWEKVRPPQPNAKQPMTLVELQQWLRHTTPAATQHHAKINPTKLVKSYRDADYFSRNLRAVEELIDQETVRHGLAAHEPWKYYDLGQHAASLNMPTLTNSLS